MSNKITTAVKYMQIPNTPKQVLKELADMPMNIVGNVISEDLW